MTRYLLRGALAAALLVLMLPMAVLAQEGIPTPPTTGLELDPALVLLGLFMPPIVAIIKQSGFSQQINSAVALVVYLVATILWLWVRGEPISFASYTANAATLTVVGLTAYKMFWSGLGIDPVITEKTSVVRDKPAPPNQE